MVDLPQPDSPTTPSVSPLQDVEADAVDRAHHLALAELQALAFQREVFQQVAHQQQRLARSADIACIARANMRLHDCIRHCLTSIAERRPSDNTLNEIDVMKMNTPGSAAIHGWV